MVRSRRSTRRPLRPCSTIVERVRKGRAYVCLGGQVALMFVEVPRHRQSRYILTNADPKGIMDCEAIHVVYLRGSAFSGR